MDNNANDERRSDRDDAAPETPASDNPLAPAAPPTVPTTRAPILCASCRYDISDQPVGGACPECGTPIHQRAAVRQTQGRAIASMILGICSIVGCFMYAVPGLVCGILALVFAKKAELEIQAGRAPVTSQGFAKAGRICGWIGLSLSIAFFLFWIVYFVFIILMLVNSGGGGGGGGGPLFGP